MKVFTTTQHIFNHQFCIWRKYADNIPSTRRSRKSGTAIDISVPKAPLNSSCGIHAVINTMPWLKNSHLKVHRTFIAQNQRIKFHLPHRIQPPSNLSIPSFHITHPHLSRLLSISAHTGIAFTIKTLPLCVRGLQTETTSFSNIKMVLRIATEAEARVLSFAYTFSSAYIRADATAGM